MKGEARAIRNAHAAPPEEPYGAQRNAVMSGERFDAALAEISSWPGYAATPLHRLDALAAKLAWRRCATRTSAAASGWAASRRSAAPTRGQRAAPQGDGGARPAGRDLAAAAVRRLRRPRARRHRDLRHRRNHGRSVAGARGCSAAGASSSSTSTLARAGATPSRNTAPRCARSRATTTTPCATPRPPRRLRLDGGLRHLVSRLSRHPARRDARLRRDGRRDRRSTRRRAADARAAQAVSARWPPRCAPASGCAGARRGRASSSSSRCTPTASIAVSRPAGRWWSAAASTR